ncbi:MAG: hypothetical protein VW236_08500 [Flavobacteriaceae bacterium]|jgi:hypothetical protein
MAFSSERISRTIAGNVIIEVWSFNAASVTSGTIGSGIGSVQHVSVNNYVSEGQGLATVSGSSVALSSVVANDTGTVVIVGR